MPRFKKTNKSTSEKDILEKAKRKAETHPFHAIKILESLIEKNPNCINAYIMLGEICISEVVADNEEFDAPSVARDAFQQALRLAGDTPLPSSVYFSLASFSPDPEAINLYQTGIKIAKQEAEDAASAGKPKTAKRIKHEVVEAYMSLAELHQSSSDGTQIAPSAEACFTEALALLPDDSTVLQVKANFLFQISQKMKTSLLDPSIAPDAKTQIGQRIQTTRQEVQHLIETSVRVWADQIDELMEHGLHFICD